MTWEECVKFLIDHHYEQTSSRDENQMYQGSTAGRTLRKGNLEVEVVFKENLEPILICRVIKHDPNDDDYFFGESSESIMCTDKKLMDALITSRIGDSHDDFTPEQKRGGMSIEVFLKVVTGDMDKYWMKVDNLNNYEAIEALDGCT
jgi:hypothetical protein